MGDDSAAEQTAISQEFTSWRQGDCTVGESDFAYRGPDGDILEEVVDGLAVLTQTCDIVRPYQKRPFVEVCPLVRVSERDLKEIERGRRPRYAFVPGVARSSLVADLDRVMTVAKPVMARWERIMGCSTDEEARLFAMALARKRARFAFPDDFVALAQELQGRLTEKHGKASAEGVALRALREIRVQATPSWNATSVSIMLWFIRNSESVDNNWASLLDAWLRLVPRRERFESVDGQVTTLAEMSAEDYVHSDPLDLHHLSSSEMDR